MSLPANQFTLLLRLHLQPIIIGIPKLNKQAQSTLILTQIMEHLILGVIPERPFQRCSRRTTNKISIGTKKKSKSTRVITAMINKALLILRSARWMQLTIFTLSTRWRNSRIRRRKRRWLTFSRRLLTCIYWVFERRQALSRKTREKLVIERHTIYFEFSERIKGK